MSDDVFGLLLAATGWAGIAFVFWRYPDFRRAFLDHWRPEAVAQRLAAWAERVKR